MTVFSRRVPSPRWALACAALLASACAQDEALTSVTQLELTVHSEESWALSQLELISEERSGLVPSTPEPLAKTEVVTLLLSDAQAGEPLAVDVWGRADGERVAFGTTLVTPQRAQITPATVRLERFACDDACLDAGIGVEPAPSSDATTTSPVCESCGPCDDAGVCESPPSPVACYAPTGTCNEDGGTCTYAFEDGASCDDGDACTVEDSCAQGACAGVAMRCDTPEPPDCLDDSTLRQYAAEGTCDADTGDCVYAATDVDCPHGCQDAACVCAPGQFEIVPVDDETDGTLAGSGIAVDRNGGAHVFYGVNGDSELRYAYKAPAGAFGEPEPVASGNYARSDLAIAVDPDGVVHVVYDQPISPPRVWYAFRATNGTWTASELASPARSPSIVADRHGTLHVSYYDVTRGDLAYAHKTSTGVWNHGFADQGTAMSGVVGEWSSIAVDGLGGVHIAYYDLGTHDLKYAYKPNGDSFSSQPVADVGNMGLWAAVAADHQGNVHIAYEQYEQPADSSLVHAYGPGGGPLVLETVESDGATGRFPGIGVDGEGGVHVVYRKNSSQLRYGYKPAGGSFSLGTIDSQGLGSLRASLAIDDANGLHVAYYDDVGDLLEYAHKPVCAP